MQARNYGRNQRFGNHFAKARKRQPGQKNKTEQAFESEILAPLKLVGCVVQYDFEPVTFRLANNCRYTPDWGVVWHDGSIEYFENKACQSGGKVIAEDDAMVKIRVAMEMHWWFGFRLAAKMPKKAGGAWKFRQHVDLGVRLELTEAGWPIIEETFEGQALKRDMS